MTAAIRYIVRFCAVLALAVSGCSHAEQHSQISLPPFPTEVQRPSVSPTETPALVSVFPLSVTVADYCLCPGPSNQFQVKLKLKLINGGTVPYDIGPANIRVMVRGDMPGLWRGNEPVAEPSQVNILGASYTAIPANGNRAFEPLGPGFSTWASFWNATTLAPQDKYLEEGPGRGDLVFYVPYSAGQRPQVDGVGVVSDDGQAVVGWSPIDAWPPSPAEPATF
jgi:hypothetical protein